MPEQPSSEQSFVAAIALGSNLPSRFGDRAANLREAVRRIGALGQVLAVSPSCDTVAEVYLEQPRFLNAALLLRTALEPGPLLHALLAVELAMGRERTGVPVKGPRLIDLDLLLYDNVSLHTAALQLPHPALAERKFVLEPLAAIAPDWMHPKLHLTMRDLLDRLP